MAQQCTTHGRFVKISSAGAELSRILLRKAESNSVKVCKVEAVILTRDSTLTKSVRNQNHLPTVKRDVGRVMNW